VQEEGGKKKRENQRLGEGNSSDFFQTGKGEDFEEKGTSARIRKGGGDVSPFRGKGRGD